MKQEKTTIVTTIEVQPSSPFQKRWEQLVKEDWRRNYPNRVSPLSLLVKTFCEQIPKSPDGSTQSIKVKISRRIARIQSLINEQLNQIIHNRKFQKLEASWRGLSFFINGYSHTQNILFRVLPTNKEELIHDFNRSIEFDQSAIFRLIYENEFGTFGGLPFTFIIGDYEFSRSRKDLFLLARLANIAAAAHTPVLSGADPGLLDMDDFSELSYGRDLKRVFNSNEMVKWWRFRKSDDSRYIALTLPKILLRLPYGRGKGKLVPDKILFEENMASENSNKYLWGNSAYALGQRICESFVRHGWLARFFGVDGDGDGIVTNLPVPEFESIQQKKMSTDVFITSAVEKELSRQGLICLCQRKTRATPTFFSARTTHKPKLYFTKNATNNETLSSMLPHILTSSRFAHYLKIILRDKIGKYSNREEIETYLNNWLNQYVITQSNVPTELKARYPLRESSVKVFEDTRSPGRFNIVSRIRPHYQLESLTASVRLISSSGPNGH